MAAWVKGKAGRPPNSAELPLEALDPIDSVTIAAGEVLDGLRLHARRINSTPGAYKRIAIHEMQKLNQALRESLDLHEHIALLRRAAAAQIPTEQLLEQLRVQLTATKAENAAN